ERPGFDPRISSCRQPRRRIDGRKSRRAFGAAQQAWPEARRFRRRSGGPKCTIDAFRTARRADAAAIDARRFDADIEAPVEAAVLCVTGRVAGVGVQHHGANMGLLDPLVSPDSDTLAGGDFTLSRGSPTHVGDGGGDMAKFAAWARPILASITLIAAAVAPATAQTEPMPTAQRPNIVLIVADDVGFTDLGAYGGEARTPNIDSLAQRGAQFSRYYSSPLCSPSRAMLLTGMDNHRTGHSTIIEVLPRELRGRPGYTMRLEPGVVTLATRLQRGGYRTYATGKWHLG